MFCYSWFDDKKKFNEKQLPPIEAFTNDLTGEECSVEGMYFFSLNYCFTAITINSISLNRQVLSDTNNSYSLQIMNMHRLYGESSG